MSYLAREKGPNPDRSLSRYNSDYEARSKEKKLRSATLRHLHYTETESITYHLTPRLTL